MKSACGSRRNRRKPNGWCMACIGNTADGRVKRARNAE
nr:MAG TPA: Meiotic chromosome segregation protein [Caudoviricetes sp.]